MKYLLFIVMLLFGFGWEVQAQDQQAVATSNDILKTRLIVKFDVLTTSQKNSTTYTVSGNLDDPFPRPDGTLYTGFDIRVNYFFVDSNGEIFIITAINTEEPLNIDIKRLDGQAFSQEPIVGSGVIYQPTPNMLLPQWVTTMSSTIQGALLSHLANMIDRKLSSVSSPTLQIKTGNYDISSNDDTILFNLSAPATVLLPTASAANGKSYKIGKVDESINALIFSPAIKLSPAVSISTLNYPRTFVVQSDGSDWWIISQQ